MNSRTREHTHAHMHKIEIKIVMFIDFVGEEIKKGLKGQVFLHVYGPSWADENFWGSRDWIGGSTAGVVSSLL